MFAAFAVPAQAQPEPAPGGACAILNAVVETGGPETAGTRRTLRCDGSVWQNRQTIDGAAGFTGIRTETPHAPLDVSGEIIVRETGLTCNADRDGALRFTSATDTWQFCNGSAWVPFEQAPTGGCAPAPTCPNVGNVCADGTVNAGCSPDGYTAMFITRCNGGRTWTGSACTGTSASLAWNNGSSAGYTNIAGTGSGLAGEANTTTLSGADSDGVAAGIQPHQAAQHCQDLTVHGQTDWYLPGIAELGNLAVHFSVLPDLPDSHFWASTQSNTNQAMRVKVDTGTFSAANKDTAYSVRCVRR